jgi:hypothetical protein
LVATASGATLGTTLRIVKEAFFGKESLLAGREEKLGPALTAIERLIREVHQIFPP